MGLPVCSWSAEGQEVILLQKLDSHVYESWLAAVGLGWAQLTLLVPAPCGLSFPMKGAKVCSYFTVVIGFQVRIEMSGSLEALAQN